MSGTPQEFYEPTAEMPVLSSAIAALRDPKMFEGLFLGSVEDFLSFKPGKSVRVGQTDLTKITTYAELAGLRPQLERIALELGDVDPVPMPDDLMAAAREIAATMTNSKPVKTLKHNPRRQTAAPAPARPPIQQHVQAPAVSDDAIFGLASDALCELADRLASKGGMTWIKRAGEVAGFVEFLEELRGAA